ncbi:MarR family transcriptional regulator [Leifsonia sp. H3M29-4]|uniref:MarR family winged helix-turn-helix transcriptional regulator n=1 Tax=Salinibacterium metalliresistens TaxID=3031321 RepID=UPI0023DB9B2C|nr:MarR family transcriptional regulator [Salinibacterium metalliresistens]MDF1479935.1 MarR family transcriptional regulator [Salinibacterium metalliresistens]
MNESSGAATSDYASDPSQDLSWLVHRAAESLADSFNAITREAGLTDLRDWLVLALISDGAGRTQGEIAAELSIDKTTLVAVLDRLQASGLITRSVSPHDRRARIPSITAKGLEAKTMVAVAKEAAIDQRLAAIPSNERAWFHSMLWRIVRDDSTPEGDRQSRS